MAQSSQVAPPEPFSLKTPDEWPKFIRIFEWFRLALICAMGDKADDIMTGFALTDEEKGDYDVVKTTFDGHFVVRRNVIFERARFNRCL